MERIVPVEEHKEDIQETNALGMKINFTIIKEENRFK